MNQFVIFLRGVNVGGNATVKMDVLKKSLAENGCRQVITYINSGNIWVTTENDQKTTIKIIKEIIQLKFGITVEMILKTKEELSEIITHDPFDPKEATDPSRKIVMMLSKVIDSAKIDAFKKEAKWNEIYRFSGNLLYVYYPDGAGRSRFTNNFVENKLQVVSTARNWNTLQKMIDLFAPATN